MTGEISLQQETHFGQRRVRCYQPRPPSLDAMFRATVAAHGGREALVAGDRRVSYAELDQSVTGFAAGLLQSGLGNGARVAILLDNVPEFLIAVLGAIRAGCIAVPMNVRQAARETAYVLQQCGASALVCADPGAEQVPAAEEIPHVSLTLATGNGSFARFCAEDRPVPDFPETGEEDCICLLYTSGTTGRPKGAMLTNLGFVHSITGFQQAYSLTEEDVSILAVPGSHVTGLVAVLLSIVTCGGKTVLMGRFKAADFLALAEAEGMSHALMVPAMYNLCLLEPDIGTYDLSRWRIAGFGGAPMPPSSIERMSRILPDAELSNAYGATETTSPTTLLPLGSFRDHPKSVGVPMPYADVTVRDDTGAELPPGEIGEIVIGGPMVVAGYWENPEANAKEFDAEGRWKSGDLGFYDEGGFLHIADRRKDIVNRGGYKIYCIEVEAILSRFDGILEAAVVAMPDPVLGEKSVAFIHTAGAPVDLDALKTHAKANLSSYKVPDMVIVTDTPLPRNANGKIVKATLRTQLPVGETTA